MYSLLCALDTQNHDVNGIHHYYRLFHHHLHTSGLTSTGKLHFNKNVVQLQVECLFLTSFTSIYLMVTNQCKTKLLFNSKLNIWWSQTDNGYQWKIVGRKLLLGSEDSFNCYLHLLPIFSGNGGWHICKVSPGAWNHSHGSMCCKCKYFIYCH